jgi:hypothetical protein
MVTQAQATSSFEMPAGGPLLGFSQLVAPVNQAKNAPDTLPGGPPLPRDVLELPPGVHASAKMAPSLHSTLRKILEGQQIQASNIASYLDSISLNRYDSAFRLLWGLLVHKGVSPLTASFADVADSLIQLHRVSPSQARNAYSAVILLPPFQQIKFMSLLQP